MKELGNYFEWGGCLLGLWCEKDDKLKCVVQRIVSVCENQNRIVKSHVVGYIFSWSWVHRPFFYWALPPHGQGLSHWIQFWEVLAY